MKNLLFQVLEQSVSARLSNIRRNEKNGLLQNPTDSLRHNTASSHSELGQGIYDQIHEGVVLT